MDYAADKLILTVSQLTSLIRDLLEENFDHIWVEGEVSNLAQPASGHLYFSLKDSDAHIRCVMFRASSRALKFKPQDGMGLIVRGRLSVYEQRGEYQLVAEYLEPKGIGVLQIAFMQLKDKLAREGLFDESRKKPLPILPRRIGIITSATGAAIRDILTVLNRRFANLEILAYPVKVQGEGAADEIAGALRDCNRFGDLDVLIVGRGGGSIEDLWAFNEEKVVRAIHASRIPVISAIGHETDFTIADFVADLRAPTPSAAAELVVRSKVELTAELAALIHRLGQAQGRRFDALHGTLATLSRAVKDPSLLLGHLGQRLDDLIERGERISRELISRRRDNLNNFAVRVRLASPALQIERCRERQIELLTRHERAIRTCLEALRKRVEVGVAGLQALSPLATLARGYSVARNYPDKSIIRSSRQLRPTARLELLLPQGSALCTVDVVSDETFCNQIDTICKQI